MNSEKRAIHGPLIPSYSSTWLDPKMSREGDPLTSCANACEDIASNTRFLYFAHITQYDLPSPDWRWCIVSIDTHLRSWYAYPHLEHDPLSDFIIFCPCCGIIRVTAVEVRNNTQAINVSTDIDQPPSIPLVSTNALEATKRIPWALR